MASKIILKMMNDIVQDLNSKTDEELFNEFSNNSEAFRQYRNHLEEQIAECEKYESINVDEIFYGNVTLPAARAFYSEVFNGDSSCLVA